MTAELTEAAKLPEPERKKLVRRLLLQWHPDKNKRSFRPPPPFLPYEKPLLPERDTHAIFLHVKAEIGRLEEAGLGDDWYERWWAAWKNGGAFPKGKPPPSASAKPTPKPEFR